MSATDPPHYATEIDEVRAERNKFLAGVQRERDEALAEVAKLTDVLRKIDGLPAMWHAPLNYGDREWAAVGSEAHLLAHCALGGSVETAREALREASGPEGSPTVTDLETIRAMFDRTGIVYETGIVGEHVGSRDVARPGDTALTVFAGDGPRNFGYSGFLACLHFTPDGDLRSVSAWE